MNNHTEYRIKTYSIADLKLAFDDESLPFLIPRRALFYE